MARPGEITRNIRRKSHTTCLHDAYTTTVEITTSSYADMSVQYRYEQLCTRAQLRRHAIIQSGQAE
eukprot:16447097-Heterocapsa_arctica.AAC.1